MSIRQILALFLWPLTAPFWAGCQTAPTSAIALVPQPAILKPQPGFFELKANTKVYFPEGKPDWAMAARAFLDIAQSSMGFTLETTRFGKQIAVENNAVYFLEDDRVPNPESYQLDVRPQAVIVRAKTAAGAFYAVQTLRQLFPPQFNASKPSSTLVRWKAPCCLIEDAPRFGYRGLMLDVGRHFFPVDSVKRFIDLLAAHKFNTFHWHLTDDQGWRIEIKKHPRLNTVGSCRKETLRGHYSDKPQTFDGKPHCGYYTQEEIKAVVAYAQARFVTIVPEIEMPGHAQAALAAYPNLGCTGGPYEVSTIWGVSNNVFCAGNDQVFDFLDDVLAEVCDLFPGTYVHVGGDECPKEQWKQCAKCQRRIQQEGLKDEHELQSYCIRRAEAMLAKRGKKLIGWDEILEGGLAPNATVMSWRGIEGGIAAARSGHHAIMSPTSHCYLDYYQSDLETEPLTIGGLLTLEKTYAYEPIPNELSEAESQFVLGVQGNLWTEYIENMYQAEYMAYPRACALAEVAWTPKTRRDWPDFVERMRSHFRYLDALGVHYAKSFYDIAYTIENGQVVLSTLDKNVQIRYTTDGTEPGVPSKRYNAPLTLRRACTLKAVACSGNKVVGKVMSLPFQAHKAQGKPYRLSHQPTQYTGASDYGLTNGLMGNLKRWDKWVGIVGYDLDPVIDLGHSTHFDKISTQYCDSRGSWIYPPKSIAVYTSDDGEHYTLRGQQTIAGSSEQGPQIRKVEVATPGVRARYIKVVATTFGTIPEGQPGAGNGAWLFLDEIIPE